ncbi:MAG: hypothetical protein FJ387_05390 [Verrucomicrobia bacterium]|nr:hypothetical protein [Verrucomicrobiota bacterium]
MTPHLRPASPPQFARFALGLLALALAWLSPQLAQGAGVRLEISRTAGDAWVHLESAGESNRVHTIQRSTDLRAWETFAVTQDGPFALADPETPASSARFFRVISRAKTATDDGKNSIAFPAEPFRSAPGTPEEARWVKFAILTAAPSVVWFQDSTRHLFHYDYALQRLAPFAGLSRDQFNARTLRRANQLAVLGAVLFAPESAGAEYGIQFVGHDPYPPEQVVQWFKLVAAAVAPAVSAQPFYLPTPEQRPSAEAYQTYFEAHGIPLGRPERWLQGDVCYSTGWALGRLVFVPAADIDAAYAEGRLGPADILLTDGVPPELPYLAGIVALTPATPNSHVAILARSYGVPFVYPADPAEHDRLRQLAGRDVMVRARSTWRGCDVKILGLDPDFEPALRTALLDLKAPGRLQLTPKAPLGTIAVNTDTLTPADIQFVGGKAAHFGLLRRILPAHSPPAVALSFDLWDGFLSQTLPGGNRTLREEIQQRLAPFQYPPDLAVAREVLAGIRGLITRTASFSPAQQQAILAALAGFDPHRKIRFRSSTNVEDSEQFTGAGLYDSYSGCLADDLDGDPTGPSHCDSTEANERGVFRALQRVYASFYNDHAWLERLRFGVPEDQVGMAVLVHHSFPDETELANGVATVRYQRSGTFRNYTGDLVTQWGAFSVSNPAGGALPEQVTLAKYGSSTVYLDTQAYSNLGPLGARVLAWPAEYQTLANLLLRVVDGYQQLFPQKTTFLLDFEYKKTQPADLVVKQVREIPLPDPQRQVPACLINEPTPYRVFQGEHGDVFALHRLKCVFQANTRNLWLTDPNLTHSLYTQCTLTLLDDTQPISLEHGTSGWPNAAFTHTPDTTTDTWSLGAGPTRRDYRLDTTLQRQTDFASGPLITVRDLQLALTVRYATPRPVLDPTGKPAQTVEDTVTLWPGAPLTARSIRVERTLANPGGLTIRTSFYWPQPPTGPTAGYTAPLLEWVETRIFGLTADPLVLRSEFAQTYHPGHHNFWEEFIFEPRLDPGVTPAQREELTRLNIQLLHATRGELGSRIQALGLDGQFRRLP